MEVIFAPYLNIPRLFVRAGECFANSVQPWRAGASNNKALQSGFAHRRRLGEKRQRFLQRSYPKSAHPLQRSLGADRRLASYFRASRLFGCFPFAVSVSSRRIDTSSRKNETVIPGTVRSDGGHAGNSHAKFRTSKVFIYSTDRLGFSAKSIVPSGGRQENICVPRIRGK